MHVQSSAAYFHVERVKAVIKDKPFFYSETHLDQLAQANTDFSLFSMPNNTTLEDHISAARYQKWTTRVKKHFGVNLKQFNRSLPFLTTQFLQSHYLASDHSLPLDKFLWEFAKSEGRQVDGIESVEFQTQVLRQISLKDQLKMLKDFLANPNKYKRKLEKLSIAYQAQEVNKLYLLTAASVGGLRRILLSDRNKRMARVILDHKAQPSVYTFGAAHLAGAQGVLALLKRGGMQVVAC